MFHLQKWQIFYAAIWGPNDAIEPCDRVELIRQFYPPGKGSVGIFGELKRPNSISGCTKRWTDVKVERLGGLDGESTKKCFRGWGNGRATEWNGLNLLKWLHQSIGRKLQFFPFPLWFLIFHSKRNLKPPIMWYCVCVKYCVYDNYYYYHYCYYCHYCYHSFSLSL